MSTTIESTAPENRVNRLMGRLVELVCNKSSIALLDQAITSGANFATVVIVGRIAGADALGVYSLGFTLLMLASAAQESLVCSPLTFYAHQVDSSRRATLAGNSLLHAIALVLCSAFLLACCALPIHDTPLGRVMLILAAMTPFLLTREFGRKYAFATLRMHVALALDASWATLQLGGLAWLAYSGQLTAGNAFLVSGAACLIASLGWFFIDRSKFAVDRESFWSDWRQNWRFGRWVFVGVVTVLVHINAVRWMIAFGIGNEAAGVFAACMAVAMLSTPFIQGMNNVLMPRAAQSFHQQGPIAVRSVVWKTTRWVMSGMAVFSIGIFALGGWVVTWIYGVEYSGNHFTVCILVLFMLSRALDTSFYNGIWAVEQPQANVRINVIALTVMLPLATGMMFAWGMVGAALGLLIGDLCGTTLRCWTFLSLTSDKNASSNNGAGVSQ